MIPIAVISSLVTIFAALGILFRRYRRDPTRRARLIAPYRNRRALAVGFGLALIGGIGSVVHARGSVLNMAWGVWTAVLFGALVTAIVDRFITR